MTDSSVASESEAVRVIIVGAGYAGLGCAIECKRKGHDVVVLEKVETFKILGETYYRAYGIRRVFDASYRPFTGDVRLSSHPSSSRYLYSG